MYTSLSTLGGGAKKAPNTTAHQGGRAAGIKGIDAKTGVMVVKCNE